MKVLSLFDGISCGYLALKRAGIHVDEYYASEIDKQAIKCSTHNHPDIIQIGDVTKVSYKDGVLYTENGEFTVGKIDLVMGGSPCQSFSSAGTGTGFNGKSGLYWEYSRVLKEVNPTYFLLENVVMKQEWQDVITVDLGVNPVEIDSALVSYQRRKRLYWTNISGLTLPPDQGLYLTDYYNNPDVKAAQIVGRRLNAQGKREDNNKEIPSQQYLELRYGNKANTLTTVLKDNVVTTFMSDTRIAVKEVDPSFWRYLEPEEYELFQTIPEGYTEILSKTQRYKAVGNAWTVDVVAHIFRNIKE